jgi:hypothetical protein
MTAMLRAVAMAPFVLGAPAGALAENPFEKSIEISKDATAHEWPFSIERGELSCFIFAQYRLVFFREPDPNDPDWYIKNIPYQTPRSVIVSTNPLEIFASLEDAELFLPFDSDFAVLIRRLTPFVAMGQALCEELIAEGKDEAGEPGAEAGDEAGRGN